MTLDSSLLSLLLGFFIAGFIGSWHCSVMCGPMSCFLTSKKQLLNYQLGRMVSYVLAGVFAGWVSQFLLTSFEWLKYVSISLISIGLITIYITQKNNIKTPRFLNKMFFKNRDNAFLLGFLSLTLPCGWLYSFILSALAARSAFAGALVMFIFWLSTLPALSAAQILMKKLIDKNSVQKQKIASLVLMVASLFSLCTFLIH